MKNTTVESIKITPASALLANSSPEVLRPMKGCGGTFQVIWIAEMDSHALLYQGAGDGSAYVLATHHNGHSCHVLAMRMARKETAKAVRQAEFITECGGTSAARRTIENLIEL